MTDSPASIFSAAGSAHFLATQWQREPVFVPAALPDLPTPPQWRALAAREDVESRRIVTQPDGRMQLTGGPISGTDPTLPWTVLIQDADHYAPALRRLFDAVDFLPRWRTEDVMMSVATAGGSVGPHVDAYDVFLVQAHGTRRWDIGRGGEYVAAPDDGGLRLVEPFDAVQTVDAVPGDILYLPPDVPHHGVAQDDCITYSIGFRAPTMHDLATVALERLSSNPRYADPGAAPVQDPARIDRQTVARVREQLDAYLAMSDATLAGALGEIMTEVKPWLLDDDSEQASVPSPASGAPLHLVAVHGARLAYYDETDGTALFANGEVYPLPESVQREMARTLARAGRVTCPTAPACRVLAEALLDDGIVRILHED